jgi:uncharacterized protein YegL
MEQTPFEDFGQHAKFVENPDPRCPSVLVLDVSASMFGNKIASLNDGLRTYQEELVSDSLASKRVEVAVVTFGGTVERLSDFTAAAEFLPPTLIANGHTPMGEALNAAIDMIDERKRIYRENGIAYYRPWIFLITDGEPNDEWKSTISRIKSGEESKQFSFFAVGVGDEANYDILAQLSTRQPLKLKGLRFTELFSWLSRSQQSVSRSNPGDEVPLSNPAVPDGWASIA